MLGARKIARQESRPYATAADFCRIFREDMNRLYLLSFLLTADHSMAEKCFVSGLESSRKSNSVFKEWAQSWARRAIVQNAIRMVQPRPDSKAPRFVADRPGRHGMSLQEEIAAVAELSAFERFAFVLSVLEGYSDRECSLLLECARTDVIIARNRALQQIGGSAEFHRKVAGIDSDQQSLPEDAKSAFRPEIIPQLAASA